MGEDDSNKEGKSNECISHSSMALKPDDILLNYMSQCVFETDITAGKKICTAMSRSLNNLQK